MNFALRANKSKTPELCALVHFSDPGAAAAWKRAVEADRVQAEFGGHSDRAPQLLTHDPLGGRLLAVPRLQKLLGQALQGERIQGGIDSPAHALQLELLAETQGKRFRHGDRCDGTGGPRQSYKLFQLLTYPLQQG